MALDRCIARWTSSLDSDWPRSLRTIDDFVRVWILPFVCTIFPFQGLRSSVTAVFFIRIQKEAAHGGDSRESLLESMIPDVMMVYLWMMKMQRVYDEAWVVRFSEEITWRFEK